MFVCDLDTHLVQTSNRLKVTVRQGSVLSFVTDGSGNVKVHDVTNPLHNLKHRSRLLVFT